MLPPCPLRPPGPTLVFYCHPSVPVPAFCLTVLYDFVKKFLSSPVQKFAVCAIDQGDKKPLEEYIKQIPNGEVAYIPMHGWEKNAAEYLLWLTNTSPLAGTALLVTKNSCYTQNVHRIQQLGWHVILVHPPGADVDLTRAADQVHSFTFVLPVQLESSRVQRHMPTTVYQNLSKKVVEMSPLDLEGTRRFVEQFKRTTCCETWPFFEMIEPACPSNSIDFLTPILDQYPTLDVTTAVEVRTDSSSSTTETTNTCSGNAGKTVEELFQQLRIVPIGTERKRRSIKPGKLVNTAAAQLIARAKDILSHQRRIRKHSVSMANRLHHSISSGRTMSLLRIHKSRKEEPKLVPYELDEVPSAEE